MHAVWMFLQAALPWLALGLVAAIFAVRFARRKSGQKPVEDYGCEGMCLGMCLGMCVGTVMNSSMGALWGMLLGLVLGTCIPKGETGKKRTRVSGVVWLALPLLLLAGLTAFFISDQQPTFNGKRVKNPDAYLMDIEKMNGTDLHTLELEEGDVLRIQFEVEQGEMFMEIKAPDGSSVYRGNGKETTSFSLHIASSGVYTVVVEGRRAKGIMHIQVQSGS